MRGLTTISSRICQSNSVGRSRSWRGDLIRSGLSDLSVGIVAEVSACESGCPRRFGIVREVSAISRLLCELPLDRETEDYKCDEPARRVIEHREAWRGNNHGTGHLFIGCIKPSYWTISSASGKCSEVVARCAKSNAWFLMMYRQTTAQPRYQPQSLACL